MLDQGKSLRAISRAARQSTERILIQEALDAHHWNRADAARSLKISYRALLYKIQDYGLAPIILVAD